MVQYISTTTKNLLVYREECFRHWHGKSFPGLVDEEVEMLYDHPEDSYHSYVGNATALEKGLIAAIENEMVDMVLDMPYTPSQITETMAPQHH